VEAIARDALALLRDCGLRKRMGQAAQQRALTTFDEDPVIDLYEAVYERVLAPAKSIVDLGAGTS
jgi:glycosyltransferase involved in cell wall biosynthesis